jgi:multiple sugar transport system substrate-binding protein
MKGLAARFENEKGIKVTFDFISQEEMGRRSASEVVSRAGHDVVQLISSYNPMIMYEPHLIDVTDIATELGKRNGGWLPIARDFCGVGSKWKAVAYSYIDMSSCYRKDLFEAKGFSKPTTWDEMLKLGRELKKDGHPFGIPISHFSDSEGNWTLILWSFGGSYVAKDGRTITIRSPETVEFLKFAKRLYEETMTSEVLGWDNAGNNRFMVSGKGSFVLNAPSIYRSALKDNPELAKNIYHDVQPTGPTAKRYNFTLAYSYGIWKWAAKIDAAKQWILYHVDHFPEAFNEVAGYDYPPLKKQADALMPILSKNPNLTGLQKIPEITQTSGFPGPLTPAAVEVETSYVISDLVGRVVAGDKIEDSIAQAEKQLLQIYQKHFGKGIKVAK